MSRKEKSNSAEVAGKLLLHCGKLALHLGMYHMHCGSKEVEILELASRLK